MSPPLALPFLALAAVLLLSGLAKLGDRTATEDMFVALKVPLVPPAVGALLLPYAEVALAAALLVARGPILVVATVLTTLLFAAYWALIARALTFDPPVSCACFGRLGGHRVDRFTLVRNTILVLLAGLATAAAVDGTYLVGVLGDFTADDWAWLGLTVLVAALAVLVAREGAAPTSSAPGGGEDDGEYQRLPIPHAVLEDVNGHQVTLRDFAYAHARLLVLLSPSCLSCRRVDAQLTGWAERLGDAVTLHAVYEAPLAEVTDPAYDLTRCYHQPARGVSTVLGMPYTPSAVLLGADGLLAGGPVVGEAEVERLVEDVLEQLHADA